MHTLNLHPVLLLLLLFSHLSCFHIVVPVSAKVLMSIDCGSSSLKPYTDKDSLVWVGDNQYVQTGETRNVITKDLPPGWDPHVMSTIREFRTRKKNCYSLDVDNKAKDSTSAEWVLVRASFYYGNYDNKSTPPTFHLQFNGNNWTQVVTSMERVVYREVLYPLNGKNTIIICLGQTKVDHLPFISALEVRSWDSYIYSNYTDPNYPLIFGARVAFGISAAIRFPEDSYGRIWNPRNPRAPMVSVGSNSTSLKANIDGNLPEIVTRTAAVNLNSSANITIWADRDPKFPVHVNLYFSEVMILNSTQKRSFNIIVNGFVFYSGELLQKFGPVSPPHGRALEVHFENVYVDPLFGYKIEIVRANGSTLPPLVNAFEDFYIGDKLVQGTNSSDVISLGLLQKSFPQLQDWSGDPCLPSPFTWDWVACDTDTDSPRVIALYLNDLGLTGSLPDFSAMDALETIDLSNNSLTNEIPEFLGKFSKLDTLYLEGNSFSGEVPCSLLKNSNLRLNVTGNPNLSLSNKNTPICRNNTESRIPSASNSENYIMSALQIIILGSIITQMRVM
ncbi:hypothetical protein MKW98_018217 [Papaver atlanticum]|uniref:Malectin-like domain-containing protein n=1 Tax=Papaver atlanticum TaxID=357466 RepID=A0AAD4RVJ5_9MAGN|nr:hypothetical protein MKW98_018217 [Papaver atlanticum]